MWTHFFDAIYLINLPHRTDRREQATRELGHFDIPFEVWTAHRHTDGKTGLSQTLHELLTHALSNNMQRILVFEDDVEFLKDPNDYMLKCQMQLLALKEWDLFYLGINSHVPFDDQMSENILRVRRAYALHAVAYSREGILKSLHALSSQPLLAADVAIEQIVQPLGHCYCCYPMLATQRPSFSDIENKNVHYDFLVERYAKHTRHLKPLIKTT